MSESGKTSEMVERSWPTPVKFAGIQINPLRFDEALDRLMALASREGHDFVITVNVDHVVRLTRHPELRALYATADLVVADGMPLVWASRMLGKPLPERVAGSDLFPALCGRAAKEGQSVFFLGGAKGAAEGAAEVLVRQHPALKIAGTCCPDFGFEKDPKQASQVLDEVRVARPDILFVGLGSPKQEQWIARYGEQSGAKLSLGVGISFGFVAGDVVRAPRWMQRFGLEWCHRLMQEPGRLWKRYLVDDVAFLRIVLKEFKEQGWRRASPAPISNDERFNQGGDTQ